MTHELEIDDLQFCPEPQRQTQATKRSDLSSEWHHLSPAAKLFAARAAIVASTGGLLFGYDIGVVEGALPQLRDEMHLSYEQQDLVVSMMVVGAIAGAIVAGYLTDGLGRWLTIVMTDLAYIGGGATLFFAQTVDVILIGRFAVGAAVAVSAVADVSYLAELAPRSMRGAMVSTNELAISLGVLVSFLAGHFLRRVHGGWRYMFGLSAVLATVQLIGMTGMPRSPRWLFSKGRYAEARAVLVKIRSSPREEEIDAELFQMELSEKDSRGGLIDLLNTWRTPLAITTSLAVLQQLTGNGNILNYTQAIFQMAQVRGPAPVVTLGVVKVLATVVAILKVDDTGRKPFLFWGALSFTACLVLLAIGFAGEWPTLSLMACWGLVAAYALSFGPVTWLVTAEMFPAGVRGKALGIGQVGSFAGSLVASSFFLRLLHDAGGAVTFMLFAVVSFGAVLFIAFAVPETKDKEPQEIVADLPHCGYCCPYSELREESLHHRTQTDDVQLMREGSIFKQATPN